MDALEFKEDKFHLRLLQKQLEVLPAVRRWWS